MRPPARDFTSTVVSGWTTPLASTASVTSPVAAVVRPVVDLAGGVRALDLSVGEGAGEAETEDGEEEDLSAFCHYSYFTRFKAVLVRSLLPRLEQDFQAVHARMDEVQAALEVSQRQFVCDENTAVHRPGSQRLESRWGSSWGLNGRRRMVSSFVSPIIVQSVVTGSRMTENSTNVPALRIARSPCSTEAGAPVASI